MDFLIKPQQLEGQIKKFLTAMKERGYSEATLKGYQSFLRKACSFMEQNGTLNYTEEYSEMCSRSWKGYITWDKYNEIKKTFPILRPKIRIPFGSMKSYAML